MPTNITAVLLVTLVTNVTNVTFEMPMDGALLANGRRVQSQRVTTTNVVERSAVTWVFQGRTNTASHDRLIYSASQVLRLKESWEAGPLTIHATEQ
jgi:hypothetical protein